jgi:V/A-type H+-transporting ATPase subunit K
MDSSFFVWKIHEIINNGVKTMFKLILVIIAGLLPLAPAAVYFLRQRMGSPAKATRGLVLGLNVVNLVVAMMVVGFGLLWLFSPQTVLAAAPAAQTAVGDPYATLAAALSTGMATIAAGIAVSNTGAAALGAIAERPETFGRALVFVGLSEGIGIYGLIVSVLILNR